MKIQFKVLSSLIGAGLVLAGVSLPAGAVGPVASYYVDCNETSASKSGAVDRGRMLPATVTDVWVCMWQGPRAAYNMANVASSTNSTDLIAALRESKRDDSAACVDDKVAQDRFGFAFDLPNNKQVFIHQACGGFTSSYSQGLYVLSAKAKRLVDIDIAQIKKDFSGVKVVQYKPVKGLDCPKTMAFVPGSIKRTRLLPHTVVAANFCKYNHSMHNQLTQMAISHPRHLANILNSESLAPSQMDGHGVLCTLDLWGSDYMIEFTLADGSGVTVTLACHGGAQSTFGSQSFQLNGNAYVMVSQLIRSMH